MNNIDNVQELHINLNDTIIPMYDDVLDDILEHHHTNYTFPGGRGSTKSSFISQAIPLLIVHYPDIHAAVFRKVGNTLKSSVFSQIIWGIYSLGLEDFFHIPKTISQPIVYKPTGQQIMFMGLDDPNKVKSIKLPFGYIGITWFEELDQFAGPSEIRKVLQSTMRGGQLFWNFRSFNPPISMNNWANEDTEEAEINRPDTLVVRNTYLDVPEDWLGPAFIQEAEILKKLNYKAYEHEYLGKAVGTGGNVFFNVEHMDMSDELVSSFSNIYNGIDWGFAIDPFRYVRMNLDIARRTLYIFGEVDSVHESNLATFEHIFKEPCYTLIQGQFKKQVPFMTFDELVTADSAEPKSIGDFRNYGAYIRPAEKGPDSVRYGIKWLQALAHIYIDKRRCPKTYKEFIRYEYEKDKDGNFISAYPDKDNHGIDAVRYGLEKFYKRRGN